MGFFGSKKGSLISDIFKSDAKQSIFADGEICEISVYQDYVQIERKFSKKSATLPMERVTDVYWGLESEIVQKNKSVIGRAFAGGLIFGGVGAVVGAVSGAQPKQVKESRTVFAISYISSSGEDAILQFEDTRHYKGFKVYKKIKELMPKQAETDIVL